MVPIAPSSTRMRSRRSFVSNPVLSLVAVMVGVRQIKNPFSLSPSGFRSKAALAVFVKRPQAVGWAYQSSYLTRIKSAPVAKVRVGARLVNLVVGSVINSQRSSDCANPVPSDAESMNCADARPRYPTPARHPFQPAGASRSSGRRAIARGGRGGTEGSRGSGRRSRLDPRHDRAEP